MKHEPLKIENTVVNVKSQKEWDIVTEYYGYRWGYAKYINLRENSFINCNELHYGTTNNISSNYPEYKLISFKQWQKLIKQHEQKQEQEMSNKEIKSFEDFKKVARDHIDECMYLDGYITCDCGGLFNYKDEPLIDNDSYVCYMDFQCLDNYIESDNNKCYHISIAELRNEPPRLEDLESDCQVVYRNTWVRTTLNSLGVFVNNLAKTEISKYFIDTDDDTAYCSYIHFNSDLTNKHTNSSDIMKITSPTGNLIWEREPEVKTIDVDVKDLIKTYEQKHGVKVNTKTVNK